MLYEMLTRVRFERAGRAPKLGRCPERLFRRAAELPLAGLRAVVAVGAIVEAQVDLGAGKCCTEGIRSRRSTG